MVINVPFSSFTQCYKITHGIGMDTRMDRKNPSNVALSSIEAVNHNQANW